MLINYLQKVYDMEKNRFLLLQLIQSEYNKINNIDNQIGALTEKRNQPIEYEPMPEAVKPITIFEYIVFFFKALIPCFIVSCFLSVIIMEIVECDFLHFILTIVLDLAFLIVFVYGGYKSECKEYPKKVELVKQKNEEITIEYENTCQKYDNLIADLNKIKKQCQNNISSLTVKRSEVENALREYYGLNILFNKYHHMEAVCKILEYLQSGRCNTLHGPSGAYDTYEKEYIGYGILDKLDKILVKMDEIQRTNVMLHRALQQVSNSVNQIHQNMSQQFKDLESHFEKSIGILEKNAEANRALAEISNTNSRNIAELLEYQNFATKQQRLSEGHWT